MIKQLSCNALIAIGLFSFEEGRVIPMETLEGVGMGGVEW